eukprot:COSAG05_NODE_227_length_13407_cov_32.277953_3_plen_59_part_00
MNNTYEILLPNPDIRCILLYIHIDIDQYPIIYTAVNVTFDPTVRCEVLACGEVRSETQ